jgi:hypothetical protein
MNYVNYLATHTTLSFDSIHHLEQDSALNVVAATFGKRKHPKNTYFDDSSADAEVHPLMPDELEFVLKERLKPRSKK